MATATRIGLLAGAAALALTAAACERYEGHEGNAAAAKVDTGAVKDAIAADEKKWNDEFHAKNRDALLAHYASDAYAVFPGAPAMSGADGLRKGYEGALKDPNFDVSFSSDKVDVSGDLAYSRGRFTEKETDPATKQVKSNSGSYITVYKKQPDGSWKVVEDFTAVEPAAAPAAQ
jgi:ketosteroid isomerase-like protein